MQLKFNIQETVETELYYGSYTIYILGGHHIETNADFFIQIENIETGEEIELTEKRLKARDFKQGRKAIKYFEFQINDYGKFKIAARNFEDIVVKESILEVFPFPISIPHQILAAITGKSRKAIDLNNIDILIT